MAVDTVEVLVTDILIKGRIDKDLTRRDDQHEGIVVEVGKGQRATEATLDHVGGKDQEGHQGSVEECLRGLRETHLDLVAVFEQEVAHGREVFKGDINNGLEVG